MWIYASTPIRLNGVGLNYLSLKTVENVISETLYLKMHLTRLTISNRTET
jgi:hypothetical protein